MIYSVQMFQCVCIPSGYILFLSDIIEATLCVYSSDDGENLTAKVGFVEGTASFKGHLTRQIFSIHWPSRWIFVHRWKWRHPSLDATIPLGPFHSIFHRWSLTSIDSPDVRRRTNNETLRFCDGTQTKHNTIFLLIRVYILLMLLPSDRYYSEDIRTGVLSLNSLSAVNRWTHVYVHIFAVIVECD